MLLSRHNIHIVCVMCILVKAALRAIFSTLNCYPDALKLLENSKGAGRPPHLLSPLSNQSTACSRWSPGSRCPGRDDTEPHRQSAVSPQPPGRRPHLGVALPVEGIGDVEGEAPVQQPRHAGGDAGAAGRQRRAGTRREAAAAAAHPRARSSAANCPAPVLLSALEPRSRCSSQDFG